MMAFIDLVPSSEKMAGMPYAPEVRSQSSLNDTERFSYRPEVYKAWQDLGLFKHSKMRLHRYELITLVAIHEFEDISYMKAHADILLNTNSVDEAELQAIEEDCHHARLTPDEIAVMEFAGKLITKSGSVTEADVDRLKSFGISDAEIFDITLTADMSTTSEVGMGNLFGIS